MENEIEANNPEVKKEVNINAVNIKDSPDSTDRLITYFSDKKQGTGTVLRNQTLSVDALLEAELAIVCYCQQQRFGKENVILASRKTTVSVQSAIY